MRTAAKPPRLGSRRQPEMSRAAILKAAIHEFARDGVAGARMEAIARSARVNKALLYYYYRDKDALYGAVLEQVFSGLRAVIEEVLRRDLPPADKFLAYVGAHFDYIASNPVFPRVVQSNMVSTGRKCVAQYEHVAKHHIRPIFTQVAALVAEGIAIGEFRPVDPMQFVPSVAALIVMYFSSAPLMKLVAGFDPLAPERIAQRRAAVLDFITCALFKEPQIGRARKTPAELSLPASLA